MSDAAPTVTRHAKWRFLQRIAPGVPHPESEIQRAFERGRDAVVKGCKARVDPETGAAFLVQNGTIVTCYNACETTEGS